MFDKQKPNRTSETESFDSASDQRTPATSTVSAARTGALIGSSITIKGDILGEESLVIEGKVEGKVDFATNDVTVGQSGRVSADITANVIKVEGEVQGDMTGKEKVVISKTGKVHGNVVAPRVTLEDGAKFKGSIDMDPSGRDAGDSQVTSIKTSDKKVNDKPASSTVGLSKKEPSAAVTNA